MAFPFVVSVTDSGSASDVTSTPAVFPASGIASGDLLMIQVQNDGSGDTCSFPVGIWQTNEINNANYGDMGWMVSWKLADGSENGTSITITCTSGETIDIQVIVIRGWDGTTPPEINTPLEQNSLNPNPNALTVSWGVDDNMFLATYAQDANVQAITAWPYVSNQSLCSTNENMAFCTDEVAAATEDPPAWTVDGTIKSVVATLGVRGGTGLGPVLTAPTASAITLVGCTPQVTTDGSDGTLSMVCQLQSVNAPSIVQIKAGLDGNGAPAPASESQAVTVTGVQTMSLINTLSDTTDYALYFVHEDATTADSNVATVDWSTVDPVAVLSNPVALNPTSTTVTPQVTSNESGGALFAYAVLGVSQTPDAATIKANAQSTSTPTIGVNTMPDISGLTPGADYTLAFTSDDTGGNPAAPVYVNFTLTSIVVNVVLRGIASGALIINTTDIEYAIWDDASLAGIGAPDAQGVGSTDGNGVMTVDYSVVIGTNGMLLARKVIAGVDNTNDNWAAGGVISE